MKILDSTKEEKDELQKNYEDIQDKIANLEEKYNELKDIEDNREYYEKIAN